MACVGWCEWAGWQEMNWTMDLQNTLPICWLPLALDCLAWPSWPTRCTPFLTSVSNCICGSCHFTVFSLTPLLPWYRTLDTLPLPLSTFKTISTVPLAQLVSTEPDPWLGNWNMNIHTHLEGAEPETLTNMEGNRVCEAEEKEEEDTIKVIVAADKEKDPHVYLQELGGQPSHCTWWDKCPCLLIVPIAPPLHRIKESKPLEVTNHWVRDVSHQRFEAQYWCGTTTAQFPVAKWGCRTPDSTVPEQTQVVTTLFFFYFSNQSERPAPGRSSSYDLDRGKSRTG